MENKQLTEKQFNSIKEFEQIRKERNEKFIVYVKTISTMSVGFLGIMLSLADTEKMSCMKHLFYSITITATSLGILASLIALYGEIASLSVLLNNLQNKIKKHIEENIDKQIFAESDPKGYMTAYYFSLFFFVCALVSATLYSWF